MKSPFPGMDPYLERHWLDVHNRLVMLASVLLNERLPSDLVASTDERVKVEGPDEVFDLFRPDVAVVSEGPSLASPERLSVGSAVMPPGTVRIVAHAEPAVERFIRIVDSATERAVTVVEFLSPTNKMGAGLSDDRLKRDALLDGNVNVVEIDLCRKGDWQRFPRPHPCPDIRRTPYRSVTRLAAEREAVYTVPFSLREPLPDLPIPLRDADPEVRLPLGELVHRVYVTGRYGTRLHYDPPADPPLSDEDAAWADQLMGQRH
jgi:hypothetical protein